MTSPRIAFAGFRFDPATGELTGPAGTTRLGPQPARVLALLVDRQGELVTRAELKDALWGNAAVEADMGLNGCIRQIRSALGDEAEQGRFIETLPRRGYRFVAALENPPDAVGAAVGLHASAAVTGRAPGGFLARSRWLVAGGAIGVLVVVIAGVRIAVSSTSKNLAILPLTPRSGDPAWVSEIGARMTEQLVYRLATLGTDAIGVVGPVTTARYANDPRPHTELGRLLDVEFVMSGNVRVSDSTVFIQVVRVADGVHVAAFRRRVVGVNLDSLSAIIAAGAAAKMR